MKKKKYEFNISCFDKDRLLLKIRSLTDGIRYKLQIINGNNAGKRPSKWRVNRSTGLNNVKLVALKKVTLK